MEDSDNKSTQCGVAFRVDFSVGTNFALEFDAPRGAIWNDLDIVIGKDTGTNGPTQPLMQVAAGQTFVPDDAAVEGEWLHLINNGWNLGVSVIVDGTPPNTHCAIDFNAEGNLPADIASYDLVMIRLQCPTGGRAAYDNFTLTYEIPPAPPILTLARSGSDLTFTWGSEFGKLYDLMTTEAAGFSAPPSTWTPLYTDLPATEPLNTKAHTWTGGTEAFFVVVEKDGPPIFSDDFETDKGWTTSGPGGDAPGTVWERGMPAASGGPTAANSPTSCYASNLPRGDDMLAEIDGVSSGREPLADLEFPAEAIGNPNPIKLEFRFISDEVIVESGWAIDDVSVSVNQ